jgi:membrane-associated protease RseP (regulator of RpoE activity)
VNGLKLLAGLALFGLGASIGMPGLPGGPRALAAQESERARLGLFLNSLCQPAQAEPECERAPVVVSVVEGGPAYRAGVRERDTLLALDGRSLSTVEGRRSIQSLTAGQPVLLSVAGPGGRRELQVTPELRAQARTMELEWWSAVPEGSQGEVRVFRYSGPGHVRELQSRLDSLQVGARGEAFVLIRPDPEVRLRIDVADSDSLFARPYVPAPDGEAATGWVVESRELASRLETVRDRTLHIARTQLDSLARLQAGIVRVPAPELGRGRVAGAEFREMTPDLAEYFHGQQEGLLVLRVIPGTPAGRLGLRGGDIVVEVNGRPVRSDMDFRREIAAAPEEPARVKWIRKGVVDEGVLGPY